MKKIKRNYRIARYVVYRQTIIDPTDHIWTFIGSLLGIGIIGFVQTQNSFVSSSDQLFLIGSFGASAVLVYGATNSPLAQPRNLIGGHLLSAIVGVSVYKIFNNPDLIWLSAALSVSVSIVLMQITKTLHPPGGATALIANIGSEKIKALGFYYVLHPVLFGVLVLFVVAILVNNIPKNRNYPYNPYKALMPWKKHLKHHKSKPAAAKQPSQNAVAE
ncbi:HPP family protein [Pontibacter qinzhouensis]|uniref:HPP family protein n=1 Tax=Pontibacter qinzhouensis TaxID=2603253 RepID=A0A5C8KD49_9BACT|nr:HPP family protein [Pontibacter qinzhouensis]TXK52854.1 HPP family protein [Pontibacter qinzhouensis]